MDKNEILDELVKVINKDNIQVADVNKVNSLSSNLVELLIDSLTSKR